VKRLDLRVYRRMVRHVIHNHHQAREGAVDARETGISSIGRHAIRPAYRGRKKPLYRRHFGIERAYRLRDLSGQLLRGQGFQLRATA